MSLNCFMKKEACSQDSFSAFVDFFSQIQFSSRSKATISESLSIADLSVISVFSNSSTEIEIQYYCLLFSNETLLFFSAAYTYILLCLSTLKKWLDP